MEEQYGMKLETFEFAWTIFLCTTLIIFIRHSIYRVGSMPCNCPVQPITVSNSSGDGMEIQKMKAWIIPIDQYTDNRNTTAYGILVKTSTPLYVIPMSPSSPPIRYSMQVFGAKAKWKYVESQFVACREDVISECILRELNLLSSLSIGTWIFCNLIVMVFSGISDSRTLPTFLFGIHVATTLSIGNLGIVFIVHTQIADSASKYAIALMWSTILFLTSMSLYKVECTLYEVKCLPAKIKKPYQPPPPTSK